MGGAASSQGAEAMIAATFMLGQAMNRVFPDIYTLSDFHAMREELLKQKRKQNFSASRVRFMALKDGKLVPIDMDQNGGSGEVGVCEDVGEEEDGGMNEEEKEALLKSCVQVPYQGQSVPVKEEDLYTPNKAGWTPLHACCHQHSCAESAAFLIEEMVKRGISLNTKTVRGPGSFASGWTPLHIASAYGIEHTAIQLIKAGATPATQNSAGWTPLHEAVHRGFEPIARALLKAGAEFETLLPPCIMTPYHPQFPLAHACRQGHLETVKCLLNAGANKDAQNPEGWCPLHEAVFFRRVDCVKVLLVHGCNTTLRTSKGHCILDFPTSEEIREILVEAAPKSLLSRGEPEKDLPSENSASSQPDISTPSLEPSVPIEESKSAQENFRLLGDLPKMPTSRNITSLEFAQTQGNTPTPATVEVEEKRDREKPKKRKHRKKKSRKNKMKTALPEEGIPSELACHLTGKLMEDPVTSPYGNNFERKALERWFMTQGNLCPVTGQPYSAAEIKVNERLKEAIILYNSGSNQASSETEEAKKYESYKQQLDEESEDDIYDF